MFTSHGDFNKVPLEEANERMDVYIAGSTTVNGFRKVDATKTYEYRAMTEDAARACMAAMTAADHVARMYASVSGAWTVHVVEVVEGTWAAIVPVTLP